MEIQKINQFCEETEKILNGVLLPEQMNLSSLSLLSKFSSTLEDKRKDLDALNDAIETKK